MLTKSSLIRKVRTVLNIIETPLLLKADRKNLSAQFIKDLLEIDKHFKGVKTILDVGAAKGRYSKAARFVFPAADIYAFEPIPDSFEILKAAFSDDKKTKVFKLALGSENKFADFHVNDWSFSSSLLTMTQTHKEIFPHTKNEKIVKTEVKRLDEIKEIEIKRPSLLKMDVQGYELEVLIGAGAVLDKFDIVQLEVNFETFYDNQVNYPTLFKYMYEHNFKRFLQMDTMYSDDNKLLASDLIFLR